MSRMKPNLLREIKIEALSVSYTGNCKRNNLCNGDTINTKLTIFTGEIKRNNNESNNKNRFIAYS